MLLFKIRHTHENYESVLIDPWDSVQIRSVQTSESDYFVKSFATMASSFEFKRKSLEINHRKLAMPQM